MPETDSDPSVERVLMMVANDVTNDTRVKKTAISAARMGFDVTVLAVASGDDRHDSQMGPIRLLRVPLDSSLRHAQALADARDAAQRRRRQRRWRKLREAVRPASARSPSGGKRTSIARFEAAKREAEVEIALQKARIDSLPKDQSGLRRVRLGLERRWRWRAIRQLREQVQAHRAELRRLLTSSSNDESREAPDRRAGWRDLLPEMHDFERAYAPAIQEIDPDIIHAHDFPMIGIAARYAILARARGRSVKVIYDAHEFTAGVALPDPRREHGYERLEKEYIHSVDAVITVSEHIAKELRDHHGLDREPDVVLNVPLAMDYDGGSLRTVRDVVALDASTPLVVYSGGISPKRRVALLVEAMEWVEDAHLVVVCDGNEQRVEPLLEIAAAGGYRERVHIAPYADPDRVAQYLTSADVGVHPLSTDIPNHQLALPNKLFEYLHAGLPMVVADNQAMRDFVQFWNLGEVFHGDDPEALAASIRTVLEDPLRYAARTPDPELLERHTWQAQEPILAEVYARVTGRDVDLVRPDLPFSLGEGRGVTATRPNRHAMEASEVRLVIGPANMAGQGWEWARALEAVSDVAVEVIGVERSNFPVDTRVADAEWRDLDWQLSMVRRVLTTHTHVMFEAGRPIFGWLNGSRFHHDVPTLKVHGIASSVVLHGSEVRDPRRHRELEPFSPFSLGSEDWARLQKHVDGLLPRLHAFDGQLFASTVGLLDYVPEAKWLPVVVDVDIWRPRTGVLEHDGPPVVVHAPTSGPLKGTLDVVNTCERLAERGLIEFRLLEGIPYSEMPGVILNADVLIDGLRLGDYGVTACQALASGRVVVGNVGPRVRNRIAGDVPIVQADPADLGAVLESLVGDPEMLMRRAQKGPEFVQRFHDGAYAGKTLAEWIENSR